MEKGVEAKPRRNVGFSAKRQWISKGASAAKPAKENGMNQEVMNLFNTNAPAQVFDSIRISLASPEKILSWSFGEIKKPETIN
jgi:hypothetical protein